MSYEAMHQVRASGLTDRTQVDVLEALAFFHNGRTGACFPSTEAIARISRVNSRTVRLTLKALHDLGFISSAQTPGQKRYFTLHLDRLPAAEPLQESTPLKESDPLQVLTGGEEITPLQDLTGEGCKNLQGTPVKTYREPLQKLTPEQGINKVLNKEEVTRNSAPAPVALPTPGQEVEEKKPKQSTDRGSRLTITDLPADWKAYAEKEEPDLDAYRLWEDFRDYWTGLSGARAIKKDWAATWRQNVRSFRNAPDWKRRPMLTREAAQRPQAQTKFVLREKRQEDRVYGL